MIASRLPRPRIAAELVGGQSGQVVLHPVRRRAGEPAEHCRELGGVHQVNHRRQRWWSGRIGSLEHLEHGLYVTLGGALVVRLGEALGRDQLVLQLGRVPVLEWVPVGCAVRSPDQKRAANRRGRVGQLAGERGRALHVDCHDRPSATHMIGEDPQHARRLTRAAGAQDQGVG
jgi:hypothetical protein